MKYVMTLLCLTGLVMIEAPLAAADVTAVYQFSSPDGNGTQTIQYRDAQHVRLQIAQQGDHNMSLLQLDQHIYMITGKTVQDLNQLRQMLAMMGRAPQAKRQPKAPTDLHDSGKTERIAGITGHIYTYTERGRQHEVVLADDPRLQQVYAAFTAITDATSSLMPMDHATDALPGNIKKMGLLRYDQTIRLQSITTATIPIQAFILPAKPQQIGGMGAMMRGMVGH